MNGARALALYHCAHLSEVGFEDVEVVAIWGCDIVIINLADEDSIPFLMCPHFHSIYMCTFIRA